MIETALVFALGALSSGILALLLFPAFTRRAARLARREVEARLPRSLEEIAALRDGVRAEYAARTARVQSVLDATARALTDERLTKAELSVELAALRTERRDLRSAMADVEARLDAAHTLLREREEALARANADRRDVDRRLRDTEDRARAIEDRLMEAERLTSEARMALAAAETRATALEDIARTAGILLPPRIGGPLSTLPPLYLPPAAASPRIGAPIDRDPEKPLTLSPEVAAAVADRLRVARRIAQASASRLSAADKSPAVTRSIPAASAENGPDTPSLPVAGAWMVATSAFNGPDSESTEPPPRPDNAWSGGALAPSEDVVSAPAIPPEVARLLRQARGVEAVPLSRPADDVPRITLPVAEAWSLERPNDLSSDGQVVAAGTGPDRREPLFESPAEPSPDPTAHTTAQSRLRAPRAKKPGKVQGDSVAEVETAATGDNDETGPQPPRQLQPVPVVNRSGGRIAEPFEAAPATTGSSLAPVAKAPAAIASSGPAFGQDEHRNRLVEDLAARLRTFGAVPPEPRERPKEITTSGTTPDQSDSQSDPEPNARSAKTPSA